MRRWDPGCWGAPGLLHVCSKGWHGVLGMLWGMLCSPHQGGTCPGTVLPIASKSQWLTHLEAGPDPSNLGTAGLGTWSRMVSSYSEIPHSVGHFLHGVSQPLCLGKKNARGI